ncbi:MAG: presqualene diphosphate synthase HpnD [Bordetella sp.]|jgi:phytoene synthase
MSPQEYCHQVTAKAGSSFTLAFRLLSAPRRLAMEALYAFCREVDDIADDIADPSLACIKLAWWQEEIQKLFNEEESDEKRVVLQHPISLALQTPIQTYNLPFEDFKAVIDGVGMDLPHTAFHNLQQLNLYCDRVAGAVGRLSARIFGPCSDQTLRYASQLGLAFQYTNILRDIGEDARRERLYLPTEMLDTHGLTATSVFHLEDSPEMRRVFYDLHQLAEATYDKALAALPMKERKDQRPGLVMAAIYRDLLRSIASLNYDVLNQRVRLGPLRKLWVAMVAALGRMPH